MIHYALRCAGGHEFDGWFKSGASFDAQSAAGLLDCPVCASTTVQRALMAPSISARAAPPAEPPTKSAPVQDAAPTPAPPAIPDQMRAVLQRMRAEIEKNCEYVGPHFASEVRRMAERAEPARPIYGEATPDEAEALAEDGIDVARIPWVPRAEG
jgi:hypothetical protein